jgi:hypothetical protein
MVITICEKRETGDKKEIIYKLSNV